MDASNEEPELNKNPKDDLMSYGEYQEKNSIFPIKLLKERLEELENTYAKDVSKQKAIPNKGEEVIQPSTDMIIAKLYIDMLKADKPYRQAVMANIAMAFVDAWHDVDGRNIDTIGEVANKAAKNFIDLLTDTKNEYYN